MKFEQMINLLNPQPESKSEKLQGVLSQLSNGNRKKYTAPERTLSFKDYLDLKS